MIEIFIDIIIVNLLEIFLARVLFYVMQNLSTILYVFH